MLRTLRSKRGGFPVFLKRRDAGFVDGVSAAHS